MPPTRIQDLSSTNAIADSDQFPISKNDSGDTRKAAASVLKAYILAAVTTGGLVSEYDSPTSSPATYTFPSIVTDAKLIWTPTGTIAVGTVYLPPTPVDKQVVTIVSSQAITSLTIAAGAGATYALVGMVSTLAAGARTRIRYDAQNNSWYLD